MQRGFADRITRLAVGHGAVEAEAVADGDERDVQRSADIGGDEAGEGFQAGQADRADGWGFNPEEAYAYQDASYGYDGYYVDLGEYQHYFREGFRRGYEDGYHSRSRYGSYSNGGYSILGTILEQILGLQLLN